MLRQLCLSRFPPIAEPTFKCLLGLPSRRLDRWCRLVGVIHPCSTGTVLFCRQDRASGFGTDPQMTAVPSIAYYICVHFKGSRRNCPLHRSLPPFSLPCPYWLHTNIKVYRCMCSLEKGLKSGLLGSCSFEMATNGLLSV